MRARIGRLLRRWADRIDPDNEIRLSGLSFTFEANRGSVVHGELGVHRAGTKGVPLLYRPEDYDKAWTGADDRPPRVLWENINEGRRPFVEHPSGERS